MLENFTVIDLIKTRSASVCTFTGNVVKFNVQTAQELRFPAFVQFLIEPKGKQFAMGTYQCADVWNTIQDVRPFSV